MSRKLVLRVIFVDVDGIALLYGALWEQSVSLAVTEPYAGSDVQGIKTTAVKTEDGKH
jgi:hypothetical protein